MAQMNGGGVDESSALVASLTLAAAAARPGDTVTALLQVSCYQPDSLELQEVEVEFAGLERVDTSWVLPAYRRGTPPINADKRKVQRYVVQSRLQAAAQGTFSDLSLRRFVIRFTLPGWLPPTFRGTAARYLYYVQATVKYRSADDGSSEGGSSAGSVSSRVPLHIWPAKQQQAEGLERVPSALAPQGGSSAGLAAAAASAAVAAADGPQLALSLPAEDVPIKCWEMGPGTAVQDAVAHIIKLGAQPPSLMGRPASPGHMPRGGSGRGSGMLGGAGAAEADTQSEISHEPDEFEAGPAAGGGAAMAPPPLKLPEHEQQAQAGDQQQALGPASSIGSEASTPRSSRVALRRPSLPRASLDAAGSAALPRSPTQLLQESGSTLRSYALRIGEQPLVRVTLHPPLEGSLQPGATLGGTLDFSQHAAAVQAAADGGGGSAAAAPGPRCMQVLILLETEEAVEQPWRRQIQGGGTAIRRVYDEHLELTADTACTHFLFTIPADAAASFHTPLVQLRWLLRFQFTASMPPPGAEGGGGDWSPRAGRIEQLSWVLPITVLPPAA